MTVDGRGWEEVVLTCVCGVYGMERRYDLGGSVDGRMKRRRRKKKKRGGEGRGRGRSVLIYLMEGQLYH